MAKMLCADGKIVKVEMPLTATTIAYVCGTPNRQIDLLCGDIIIAGLDRDQPKNKFASFLTKEEIWGEVILCSQEELD